MTRNSYKYKLPPVEKAVNRLVSLVFYYRLLFVLGALVVTGLAGAHVYYLASPAEGMQRAALIVTFGSVIIGIFYSILNYEHNQLRFRHESQVTRDTLTFTCSCKMHEADTILHFKALKVFYDTHRASFAAANYATVKRLFREQQEARIAFIVLFNYFEGISIGLQQGIMDEAFVKEFFRTVFIEYHQYFGGYIHYLRNDMRSQRVFCRFTEVAERWRQEN